MKRVTMSALMAVCLGGMLLLSGCATTEQLKAVEATANSAAATANAAKASADAAMAEAKAAHAAADRAEAAANAAKAASEATSAKLDNMFNKSMQKG